MSTFTVAKARAWCLNCPNVIRPGDEVIVDQAYAKPGTNKQPMIHTACEGLDPYDPDAEPWDDL